VEGESVEWVEDSNKMPSFSPFGKWGEKEKLKSFKPPQFQLSPGAAGEAIPPEGGHIVVFSSQEGSPLTPKVLLWEISSALKDLLPRLANQPPLSFSTNRPSLLNLLS